MNPAIKLLPEEHHERENFYMNRKKKHLIVARCLRERHQAPETGNFFSKVLNNLGVFSIMKNFLFEFFSGL